MSEHYPSPYYIMVHCFISWTIKAKFQQHPSNYTNSVDPRWNLAWGLQNMQLWINSAHRQKRINKKHAHFVYYQVFSTMVNFWYQFQKQITTWKWSTSQTFVNSYTQTWTETEYSSNGETPSMNSWLIWWSSISSNVLRGTYQYQTCMLVGM